MATSSIFHNVILRTPEQVEAFIRAAEASLADPYVRPEEPLTQVENDPEVIRRIFELNEKNCIKIPYINIVKIEIATR